MNNKIKNVWINAAFACLKDGGKAWVDGNEVKLSQTGRMYWVVEGSLVGVTEERLDDVWSVEWPTPELPEGYEFCERDEAEKYCFFSPSAGFIIWDDGIGANIEGCQYFYAKKKAPPKANMTRVELYRDDEGDLVFNDKRAFVNYLAFAKSVSGFCGYEYEGLIALQSDDMLFKHIDGSVRGWAEKKHLESGDLRPIYPVAFWVMEALK